MDGRRGWSSSADVVLEQRVLVHLSHRSGTRGDTWLETQVELTGFVDGATAERIVESLSSQGLVRLMHADDESNVQVPRDWAQ